MNKNINNIIRLYLLPSKSIINSNKRICLNELMDNTQYILYDLNRNQALILRNMNEYIGDLMGCKNYNNTKYYYDNVFSFGWLIIFKD